MQSKLSRTPLPLIDSNVDERRIGLQRFLHRREVGLSLRPISPLNLGSCAGAKEILPLESRRFRPARVYSCARRFRRVYLLPLPNRVWNLTWAAGLMALVSGRAFDEAGRASAGRARTEREAPS